MEGGSWTRRGNKLNEYNEFCKNILNHLIFFSLTYILFKKIWK